MLPSPLPSRADIRSVTALLSLEFEPNALVNSLDVMLPSPSVSIDLKSFSCSSLESDDFLLLLVYALLYALVLPMLPIDMSCS